VSDDAGRKELTLERNKNDNDDAGERLKWKSSLSSSGEVDEIDTIGSAECKKWNYDYEFLYGYRSMTSELNWVCQNNWKSITGQSAYFIGSVFGTLILGILADTIGRLPVLISAHLFGIVGNGLTIFATNEITFALFRFISGIATDNNFVMMYILVLEYIAPNMRTLGLNLCIGIFYCIGSVATPWLAVWLGNWKLYLTATIIPALVVPTFYFFIPESAEWLISQNKLDEALVCYQRIAKMNGRELDEKFIDDFHNIAREINSTNGKSFNDQNDKSTKSPTLLDLFKTPRLRRLTLILFFKS
jgi:MFS family permease